MNLAHGGHLTHGNPANFSGRFYKFCQYGVSQTDEDPAIQGGVDVTIGSGYVGVWASNVDFGTDDPSAEIDLYAGVKPTLGDTSLDLGVIYYGYVDDKGATPGQYGYLELKAAASRADIPRSLSNGMKCTSKPVMGWR